MAFSYIYRPYESFIMNKLLILISVSLFTTLALTSCNDCRKIDCQNGGTCNDGACDCLKGYEGEHCETPNFCVLNEVECNHGDCLEGKCECDEGYELSDCSREARAKFIGDYKNVTETCDDSTLIIDNTGTLTIERHAQNAPNMVIKGMFQSGDNQAGGVPPIYSGVDAIANVNANTFRIPDHSPDDNLWRIKGSGKIIEGLLVDTVRVDTLEIDYTISHEEVNAEYSCSIRGTIEKVVKP